MSQAEGSRRAEKRLTRNRLAVEAALNNSHPSDFRIQEYVSRRRNDHSDQSTRTGNKKVLRKGKEKVFMDEATVDDPSMNDPSISEPSMTKPCDSSMTEPCDSSMTESSRKKRGVTRCKAVAKARTKILVEFNKKGQPIGDSSREFSSFLGLLGREKVSINVDDWRYVSDEHKELFWEVVLQKFKFREDVKDYVLQHMGKLWRSYKSRLGANLQEKPDHVSSRDWRIFVKKRSTKSFKSKSKSFKEMRKKQNELPYTGSRIGYARMEDEMIKNTTQPSLITTEDVWVKVHTRKSGEPSSAKVADIMQEINEAKVSQPSKLVTSTLNDVLSQELRPEHDAISQELRPEHDVLSQVLRPKRSGRVRGMGFGVTPARLRASKSSDEVSLLREEIASLKEKVERIPQLENLVITQQKLIDSLLLNQVEEGSEEKQPTNFSHEESGQKQPTTASQHESNNQGSESCILISWMPSEDEVAIGSLIMSKNNVSRVWVERAIDPDAPLWREHDGMRRISDAVGRSISWPTNFLEFEE